MTFFLFPRSNVTSVYLQVLHGFPRCLGILQVSCSPVPESPSVAFVWSVGRSRERSQSLSSSDWRAEWIRDLTWDWTWVTRADPDLRGSSYRSWCDTCDRARGSLLQLWRSFGHGHACWGCHGCCPWLTYVVALLVLSPGAPTSGCARRTQNPFLLDPLLSTT